MRKDPASAKEVPSVPNSFFRARYASFLAQMVVIRRCSLSCRYCSEYDKFSDPVSAEVLEKRLLKLKELGTFGILLTGWRCSLLLAIC
jgi:MoaA/NifB/PqqE/SkfB family radical SAM enzyme